MFLLESLVEKHFKKKTDNIYATLVYVHTFLLFLIFNLHDVNLENFLMYTYEKIYIYIYHLGRTKHWSTIKNEEILYQILKILSRNMYVIKAVKVMYPDGSCSSKPIRF